MTFCADDTTFVRTSGAKGQTGRKGFFAYAATLNDNNEKKSFKIESKASSRGATVGFSAGCVTRRYLAQRDL